MKAKQGGISSAWERWRVRRVEEYVSGGMPRETARRVAEAEARGRARIARHIGFVAAARAVLRHCEGIGATGWFIEIDPALVPEERRAAAQAELNPAVIWG